MKLPPATRLPSRRSRAAAHDGSDGSLDLGREILEGVRVGIAHHLGWAVAVTASVGHEVVDRRRIELIEPGMPTAPVEHEAKALDGDASARMVAEVHRQGQRRCRPPWHLALRRAPAGVCGMSRMTTLCGNLHRAGLTRRPGACGHFDLRRFLQELR